MTTKPKATDIEVLRNCYDPKSRVGSLLKEYDLLRAENASIQSEYGALSVDYGNLVNDYNRECGELRAENARQAETIAKLRVALQDPLRHRHDCICLKCEALNGSQ